ncbi:hypothetical protein GQ54DRAFT_327017 [Martensiomyces pterosporus]|nr:hypothetical protein GQ54DRAFT_327017 [Martensiomyces pterosporus]
MSEKEYECTIKRICTLLQSEPTPDVIQGLRESFGSLGKQLKAGPFLEVFETTLSNIPFSALFSLLAAPDNKLIVIVAEVTGLLLKPVTWAMVHQTFEEYIIQGLGHPHPNVKCLVLSQFLKCEQAKDPFSPQYGPHIWKCLEGKGENEATKLAKQVLIHLCKIGMGLEYLFTSESLAVVKQTLAGNEGERFRVYDVVAAAVAESESAFEFFRQEGIVETFLEEEDRRDVLVVMNFYELVPDLCASPTSFEYLDSQGVFKRVLKELTDSEEDSVTTSLLRTAGLKLLSRVVDAKGVQADSFLEQYAVAPILRDMILRESGEARVAAISCLGAIGNNPQALEYLAKEDTALSALATAYNGSLGRLRVECLQAIACVFGHSQTPGAATSQACYDLYMRLSDGKLLVDLTKEIMKGFEESCVAAFAVFQKLSWHAWGVREIASYQNITNFLLTRDASRGKTVQQWQFATIESIVASPSAKDAFGDEDYTRLRRYVNEGPFFVNSVPQVALKSS